MDVTAKIALHVSVTVAQERRAANTDWAGSSNMLNRVIVGKAKECESEGESKLDCTGQIARAVSVTVA